MEHSYRNPSRSSFGSPGTLPTCLGGLLGTCPDLGEHFRGRYAGGQDLLAELHQGLPWASSVIDGTVCTIILMSGNLYAVCMLILKLFSVFAHQLGCVGAGSARSWQDACLWACCGTMKLADTSRKGFHASPLPPTPSAPPLMDPGSKPFLNKGKGRRARKKSQAPPTAGSTDVSRTGHLPPLPRAAAPPFPIRAEEEACSRAPQPPSSEGSVSTCGQEEVRQHPQEVLPPGGGQNPPPLQ